MGAVVALGAEIDKSVGNKLTKEKTLFPP